MLHEHYCFHLYQVFLRRLRKFSKSSGQMMLIKLLIYFALCFISKLLSFGLGATTGSNLSQLLVMQKRFLTTIANVPLLHPTAQLFKKFRII